MINIVIYLFKSILSSPVSHSKQRAYNSERQLDRTMKLHLSQMLDAENGLIKADNFLEVILQNLHKNLYILERNF